MRPFVILLFLINHCWTNAQQHELPFPDSNAVWIHLRAQPVGVPPNYTYDYCHYKVFSHDTAHVNGEVYNKLYFGYYQDPMYNFEFLWDDISWFEQIGLFRTDSLKVYYKPIPCAVDYPCFVGFPFDDNDPFGEYVLYDFGIAVGDTFDVRTDKQIVLESIDSIDINGTYYRKFNFTQPNWYSGGDYHWIEGIGSDLGFFSYFNGFENYLGFECFHEDPDGTWIYPAFSYSHSTGGCDFVSIDEIQENSIKLYPNPTSGFAIVELNEPSKIMITNARGQQLMERIGNKGVNLIDVTMLQSGFYIVKVDGISCPLIVE